MRLVVDANVIISAMARDSAVRAALRTTQDDVHVPAYVRDELRAHRTEIRQKSGLTSSNYDRLLDELLCRIIVVGRAQLVSELQEAARTMHGLDPDDAPYVAAALAVDGTVVSNDRAFERQQVVSTQVDQPIRRARSRKSGRRWLVQMSSDSAPRSRAAASSS